MARREIKQFVVGKHITETEVELLILRLAKWFADPKCDRRYEDPEKSAREIVKQCLNAETKDGSPWKNAPDELSARIRIKAAYNMDTGEGIAIKAVKNPDAVRKTEVGAGLNNSTVNSLNPIIADFNIEEFRQQEERKLLSAYADLDSPAMLPHVRRLTMLYAQQEVLDRELALCNSKDKRKDLLQTLDTLNKTLESVLKILDIHPESLRKKIKESADGALGDLVASIDGEEFRETERLWALQAALQLWASTIRMNGRGDAPQLSAWELWHMTRSIPFAFTCKCGRHYPHLVRGFTPKQLKDFLKEKGVLVNKTVMPVLLPQETVDGLEEFIDTLPEMLEPNKEIK